MTSRAASEVMARFPGCRAAHVSTSGLEGGEYVPRAS